MRTNHLLLGCWSTKCLQCLELDFRKPNSAQIATRMAIVCRGEGLAINDATLRALIEGSQGDLRLVLGQLQVGAG